jgi:hypothetical protein
MEQLTKDQRAFERFWKRQNKDRSKKFDVWLKRSDMWGANGYEQPSVHFDWLTFQAGAKWARKQS